MALSFMKLFKLNWRYRSYHIWVINTTIECNLYLWDNWCLLLPSLDTLVRLTAEPAFIRTFQAEKYKKHWLGFGRMKWNEENNIKWTTKYRESNPSENEIEFHNTEIWAPDWKHVCDTGIPPDIFICLYHYPTVHEIREGLTIALPRSFYKKNQQLVNETLVSLSACVRGANLYETKRDWWGRTASRNNIEDMGPQDIKRIIGL